MSIKSSPFIIWFFVLIGLCLTAAFAVKTALDYADLRIRLAFADDQTEIFGLMADKARNADAEEAIGYLEYITNYYPSGTKQIANSRLDAIVERARRGAVTDVIAGLRKKTGKEYGDDPEEWLRNLKPK